MGYQKTTWTSLRSQAADRLGNSVFWSNAELELYITEALRIWNVLTGRFNGSETIPSVANQTFYTTSLVSTSVTDQNILNEVQYHLLETPNNGASLDSSLWSISEWIDCLNRAYRNFLSLNRLILSRNTLATGVGTAEYDLNDLSTGLLDVVRVAWKDSSGNSFGLARLDHFSQDHTKPTWRDASGTPVVYNITRRAPQKIQIIPAPSAAGDIDVVYTDAGTDLSNSGVALTVPNDFTPYVKWAFLEELLSKDSEAHDPLRAGYCRMRFLEGWALALFSPHHYTSRSMVFGGTSPMSPTSLHFLDSCAHQWQNQSGTTPTVYAPVGLTQFAVHKAHTAGGTNFTILGVTDAPVYGTGTNVDLSEGEIPYILDYVQHIAGFKQGGQEFQASLELYKNFINGAKLRNSNLDLNGILRDKLGQDLDYFYQPLVRRQDVEE